MTSEEMQKVVDDALAKAEAEQVEETKKSGLTFNQLHVLATLMSRGLTVTSMDFMAFLSRDSVLRVNNKFYIRQDGTMFKKVETEVDLGIRPEPVMRHCPHCGEMQPTYAMTCEACGELLPMPTQEEKAA